MRYTGVSIAFNVSTILGGGIAPYVSQSLAHQGGLAPVGVYLSICGAVSLVGLMLARRASLQE